MSTRFGCRNTIAALLVCYEVFYLDICEYYLKPVLGLILLSFLVHCHTLKLNQSIYLTTALYLIAL